MRPTLDPPPVSPGRRTAWLVGGAVILLAIVLIAIGLIRHATDAGSYRPDRLSAVFAGLEDELSPVEDTAELCAQARCVEGWRTDVGTFLQFGTGEYAEYWSMVIGGDVVRNGTVLLDRNGYELTDADRELSVQLLFPGHDWDTMPLF